MVRVIYFSCLLCFVSHAAYGQSVDINKLGTLTQQQKSAVAKAGKLSAEQQGIQKDINKLQNDLVSATAQSRGFEREAMKNRQQLAKLLKQENSLKAIIIKDNNSLADMLAALQRIEIQPPPTILLNSQNAVNSARAALLLSSLSKGLHEKSKILSEQLEALANVQKDISKNSRTLSSNVNKVNSRLIGIRSVLKKKSRLETLLDKDRKSYELKAKRLAEKAQNLRDLISRFEERAEKLTPRLKPPKGTTNPVPHVKPKLGNLVAPVYVPSGIRRFADARGHLPLPALGALSRKYGAKLSSGGKAKGISLKTDPLAQVIAPFSARVEFSGLFNKEHVVILNVGNGYFIVLTGLGETFSSAGDRVKAGQPLGLMPNLTAEIFMEFRKNRASIDPMPWIGPALAK